MSLHGLVAVACAFCVTARDIGAECPRHPLTGAEEETRFYWVMREGRTRKKGAYRRPAGAPTPYRSEAWHQPTVTRADRETARLAGCRWVRVRVVRVNPVARRTRAQRDILLEAATELEARYSRFRLPEGRTYCSACDAPQGDPWEHAGCAVALLRAKAAGLKE